MRAVHIVRIGLPETALRVLECAEPAAGPGRVRIRVRAFGVTYADLLARTGMDAESPRLPWVPGQEVAGIVEDDGEEGARFAPGTPVAALTLRGGYAEVATARPEFVVPIPPGMEFADAATVPAAGATAWLALSGLTSIRAGDRVLVHAAAGGVGLLAIQMALAAGCEVFGTVGSEPKVAFLRDLGVQHPMNHASTDIEAAVGRAAGNSGMDLVLDSPRHDTLLSDLRMLAPSGRLVIFGATAAATAMALGSGRAASRARTRIDTLDPWALPAEGKGILGVNLLRTAEARPALVMTALREVFAMIRSGRLRPHVDTRFDFADCARAHERLHGRESIGKVVVTLPPSA
jgi:NADPH2:quinone reductase